MKLFKLQQEIGKISKSQENPFYKSRYFDINKLLEQLQPLLEKHKLLILQPLGHIEGKPAIQTRIVDAETGDIVIATETPLPDIQDPQKMGSAITYYRRYSLQSLLGLQAEDDDGNSAIPQLKSIPDTKKQKLEIMNLAENLKPMLRQDKKYKEFVLEVCGVELKEENFAHIIKTLKEQQ